MHIFISYRTNAEPDRRLCDHLSQAFKAERHQAFVDRYLPVGDNWAKEIEHDPEAADFLVLLLAEEAAPSEMVLGEVERARELCRGIGRNLTREDPSRTAP